MIVKVGCVISSEYRMGDYLDDNHREGAPHFIIFNSLKCLMVLSRSIARPGKLKMNMLYTDYFLYRIRIELDCKPSILDRLGLVLFCFHHIVLRKLQWVPCMLTVGPSPKVF